MITNIVDRRTNAHKWLLVDAVVEPTWHDNTVKGADRAEKGDPALEKLGYEEICGVRLSRAFEWAEGFAYPTTLYIYDPFLLPQRGAASSQGESMSEHRTTAGFVMAIEAIDGLLKRAKILNDGLELLGLTSDGLVHYTKGLQEARDEIARQDKWMRSPR